MTFEFEQHYHYHHVYDYADAEPGFLTLDYLDLECSTYLVKA